jgi:hypothetical protein
VQQILHIAMRIIDQHLRRTVLKDGLNDGVHFVGHEAPAERVILTARLGHPSGSNAADPLHVHGDEDLERPLGLSWGGNQEGHEEQPVQWAHARTTTLILGNAMCVCCRGTHRSSSDMIMAMNSSPSPGWRFQ